MRVYLAGPGVFRPDAQRWGEALVAACQTHGLTGLYPLDQQAPAGLSKHDTARWIFEQNCRLIDSADLVLADVRAFRSASEPDSGTAFEIGYASARNKPVWLWLPEAEQDKVMADRVPATGHPPLDAAGWLIEDFDAPLNLMLWHAASGILYADDIPQAVRRLAARIGHPD
ncbi:nucleoside 2-deoxyribosyltransferase [Chitinibacteraceae bacterium HSL-7]